MLRRVAELLANGAIVGWFQGRMEFGPRALGNRSFLADPRRSDMRELLNKKVKKSFRSNPCVFRNGINCESGNTAPRMAASR